MFCAERFNRIPTCLYSSVLLDGVGFRGRRVQARSDPPLARLSAATRANRVVKVFVKAVADHGRIEVGDFAHHFAYTRRRNKRKHIKVVLFLFAFG
jgi:hypothetical protein